MVQLFLQALDFLLRSFLFFLIAAFGRLLLVGSLGAGSAGLGILSLGIIV